MRRGRARWTFFFTAILLLLAGSPGRAFPQPPAWQKYETPREPVRLRADHLAYDQAEDSYVAEGNVEAWQGDRKLTADRLVLRARTNELEARGNVVLVQGEDVLRSEEMRIALDTSLGLIVEGTLFLKQQNYYLYGEEIERLGESTYRIRGGIFTTCDGPWPAWRFTGREALVVLEEYATIRGATFQVKNIPLLYSPYLVLPMKSRRESGFLVPQVGYSDVAGLQFDNAYFWAIAKNLDATFFLDLSTRKGVGKGLEFRYIRQPGSAGELFGYHIGEFSSFREQRTQQLDRGADRWLVEWKHEELSPNSFFSRLRLWQFSDRQYFRDYGRSYEERAAEQAYSFLSLTRDWERYSLSGEVRHTVNLIQEDPTTLQNYPLINFTGLQRNVPGSPFYFGFDSSYGYFWRREGSTGHRLDLHPRVSLPLKWNFLEVSPELGVRETAYYSRNGAGEVEGLNSRELLDFSTRLATSISRVFETGWSSVPKLRHLIRPEITYAYIPPVSQRLPSYDLPVPRVNAFQYGLTQRLVGKVFDASGQVRYHEFAYLRLGQTYDFFEAGRELVTLSDQRKPFGPISADLKIFPLEFFSLENTTAFDPNTNSFLSSYTLFRIWDSRGDFLHLEHRWDSGIQEQINGVARVQILPPLSLSFGLRYSLFDQKTLESQYGLRYQHQCWSIDLTFSEKPSIAGDPSERKMLLMLTLVGVGSVGRQ
ncbi:MAG: LPS-assembly protein LptD [Deltaproteobacteria bacterium]|nr:LPS-assembly protein LptD [Deltaproteobacteria bacterium]